MVFFFLFFSIWLDVPHVPHPTNVITADNISCKFFPYARKVIIKTICNRGFIICFNTIQNKSSWKSTVSYFSFANYSFNHTIGIFQVILYLLISLV